MPELNPPFVVRGPVGSPTQHSASAFRRPWQMLTGFRSGALQSTDLVVAAHSPNNMSVDVSAGDAMIRGTSASPSQGTFHVQNSSTVTVTIAANASGNPRIDLVVARVRDDESDSSGTSAWAIEVVQGTPAASPVAPATPASAIALAQVAVANGASSIVAGNITDVRPRLTGLAPPPLLYQGTLNNGSSTTFVDFFTQNTFPVNTVPLTLPVPFRMLVTAACNVGFTATANIVDIDVRDEAGAAINYKPANLATYWRQNQAVNAYQNMTVVGRKDYAAGATPGCRLAYKVNVGNTYIDAAVRVELFPL